MERVETLCNLLSEKLQNKSSINDLLSTVKMLESELLHLKNITPPTNDETAVVTVLYAKNTAPNIAKELGENIKEEEKTVEILQINEEEVQAELDEIKRNAAEKTLFASQNRPAVTFDDSEDIPTLANRQKINSPKELNETINVPKEINDAVPKIKEINEALAIKNETTHAAFMPKEIIEPSLIPTEIIKENIVAKEINDPIPTAQASSVNDVLKQPTPEISDSLQDAPIKDLKKAIGVNERFLYLNELFRGDEAMYEKSIKTINSFEIYAEAEFWIRRELKLRLGWNETYNSVKQFDQLVRRRFS